MRRVRPDEPTLMLVNPASRRGQDSFDAMRQLAASRLNLVDAHLTTSADDMVTRIRAGLSQGVSRFLIGGGDGTLSQAADELAGTDGVLGVLPVGTGNTFSHGLSLPSKPEELMDLLAEGPARRYDLGVAIKGKQQKVFLNSLTMGFSQRLVEMLSRETKNRLGYAAWILEFRQALATTPVLTVRVTADDVEDVFQTRQLVIVNGRTIAAGISATPASSGEDGLLEVFRLGSPSFLSILRLGTKLLMGRLLTDQEAHYQAVTDIALHTEPALPVNIDGELWLKPPLSCRVWPAALWVIAPHEAGPSPHRWPLVTRTLGGPRVLAPRSRHYSLKP